MPLPWCLEEVEQGEPTPNCVSHSLSIGAADGKILGPLSYSQESPHGWQECGPHAKVSGCICVYNLNVLGFTVTSLVEDMCVV